MMREEIERAIKFAASLAGGHSSTRDERRAAAQVVLDLAIAHHILFSEPRELSPVVQALIDGRSLR